MKFYFMSGNLETFFFKAPKSMSSSKVNDQPAVVDVKTNDNGQGKVFNVKEK